MAYSAWASSSAYAVGDIVRASAPQASGLVFRCTTAGTSAGSEPAWGTDIGSTITDNTVVWTAIASAYEELAKIAPSAIIELFEMTLDAALHGSNDTYRWHNGANADVTGNIVWNGNTYFRLPIQAEGFDYTNTGTLPRPTLTINNLDSVMTALLLLVNTTTAGNDLGGAQVKRIRTLKKYLDGEAAADPYAHFPEEIWFVDRKASESRNVVSFELASKFDLAGVMLPKRQLIANICQWRYRSAECGYTGTRYFDKNDNSVASFADDVCGKRLDSCSLRFGQVSTTGTVLVGSNQLTLSSAVNIGFSDPIKGFAVPSGTTVVSVNGNTVTMSATATATTTVSVTGTLQASDTSKIVVSNSTGIIRGMTVTGPYLGSDGAMVESVSGNTITLAQAEYPSGIYYRVGSDTYTPYYYIRYTRYATYIHWANKRLTATYNPQVGDIMVSDYSPLDSKITVTAFEYLAAAVGYLVYNVNRGYYNAYEPDKLNITYPQQPTFTISFYRKRVFNAGTYTFKAPNTEYTFRNQVGLPYGSFPGVGLSR